VESKKIGIVILHHLFREPRSVMSASFTVMDDIEEFKLHRKIGFSAREAVVHCPKLQSPEYQAFTKVLLNSIEQPQNSIKI
jgi:hypothetical protein